MIFVISFLPDDHSSSTDAAVVVEGQKVSPSLTSSKVVPTKDIDSAQKQSRDKTKPDKAKKHSSVGGGGGSSSVGGGDSGGGGAVGGGGESEGRGKGSREGATKATKKEGLVDIVLSDVEGEYGPRTSSPDRGTKDFPQLG